MEFDPCLRSLLAARIVVINSRPSKSLSRAQSFVGRNITRVVTRVRRSGDTPLSRRGSTRDSKSERRRRPDSPGQLHVSRRASKAASMLASTRESRCEGKRGLRGMASSRGQMFVQSEGLDQPVELKLQLGCEYHVVRVWLSIPRPLGCPLSLSAQCSLARCSLSG
jgi:hypothetical protein